MIFIHKKTRFAPGFFANRSAEAENN